MGTLLNGPTILYFRILNEDAVYASYSRFIYARPYNRQHRAVSPERDDLFLLYGRA
jgi:hypothetical protein